MDSKIGWIKLFNSWILSAPVSLFLVNATVYKLAPGQITGLYIDNIIQSVDSDRFFQCKGRVFPGKGFLWGMMLQKMGFGIFLGQVS